jgi:hypothetical protein
VLSAQAPEGGAGDEKKRGEEKTRKDKISEKSFQEEQKTDDNLTSSIVLLFNWAGNVEASVTPIFIRHNEPIPIVNDNMSISASTHTTPSIINVLAGTTSDINFNRPPMSRDCHGYGYGSGFWHTMTYCVLIPQYHGYAWVNYNKVSKFFLVLKLVFSYILS